MGAGGAGGAVFSARPYRPPVPYLGPVRVCPSGHYERHEADGGGRSLVPPSTASAVRGHRERGHLPVTGTGKGGLGVLGAGGGGLTLRWFTDGLRYGSGRGGDGRFSVRWDPQRLTGAAAVRGYGWGVG
jgi:hypothetical protein